MNWSYDALAREQNWTDNCLCRNEYVESRVQTCLLVNDPQYTYRLHTSPFEIYSAGRLKQNKHSQMTRPAAEDIPIDVSTALTPLNKITHLDTTNDALHVYRLGSSKLYHYLKGSKFNIALVARTVTQYGDKDNKRKSGCGRILNFGVNGDYGTTTMETITVKVRFSIAMYF